MEVTKPYKFIGFAAMEVTKPYKFIGFVTASKVGLRIRPHMRLRELHASHDVRNTANGRSGAMEVTKLHEFIGFGAMEVTKPYKLIGFVTASKVWSAAFSWLHFGLVTGRSLKVDPIGTGRP